MRASEYVPFYVLGAALLGILALIPIGYKNYEKARTACEAKGGKYITGKGVNLCLDKKAVIELDK